ncbi:MAG: hypothetical protein ACRCZQ_12115 [Bacteroidales bacterium]
MNKEEDYSWSQDLRDWDERQDKYERWGLGDCSEVSEEWEDGIPPEIQELIDWYKNNNE